MSSNLIFLRNSLSSSKFLVATGASICVPSPASFSFLPCCRSTTQNRRWFPYGNRRIALQFGSRRFDWNFLLADVSVPILGSDFLRHFHLLVHIAGSHLLDATTLEPLPAVSSSSSNSKSHLYAALISTPHEFCDLLAEYPDVVCAKGFSSSKPKHQVLHSVPIVPGPPVFAKACRLDAEKLESARKEFAAMEAAGVIRWSSSPWASPLHMVQKPDGSWRPCGFSYLFTIVDRTSRWREAVPVKSITAEEFARAMLIHWIPLFGISSVITSYRGSQFTSSIWSQLCFHPQSNGLVECFHRQLKVSLRARLAGSDWFYHLPLVLIGLRNVPRDDLL